MQVVATIGTAGFREELFQEARKIRGSLLFNWKYAASSEVSKTLVLGTPFSPLSKEGYTA